MISTQVLAEERVTSNLGHSKNEHDTIGIRGTGSGAGGPGLRPDRPTDMDFQGEHDDHAKAIKQCNQIANVSKRTIKAAISGVAIAEVIDKVFERDFGTWVMSGESAAETLLNEPAKHRDSSQAITGHERWELKEAQQKHVRAIYKTVDQIKTKYGQVRPQDRVRLNNRVEQQLIECRKTAFTGQIGIE